MAEPTHPISVSRTPETAEIASGPRLVIYLQPRVQHVTTSSTALSPPLFILFLLLLLIFSWKCPLSLMEAIC